MVETEQTDVAIMGAGMAGLVAAVDLVSSGVDVLVFEKADRPGGSMRISNGAIWTYLPYERLRDRAPDGDPVLQRLLADRFEDDLAWLESIGASFAPLTFEIPGTGTEVDPASLTDHLVDLIETDGGELRLRTPVDSIRTDDDGTVVGLTAMAAEAERLTVEASAVVIATGGFQGNESLLERYVVDDSSRLYLRSVPHCTGDGLLSAEDVGAKTTGGLGTFYGHGLVAPPAEFTADEFADASQYYGSAAVALDRHGERFTDESESSFEETLAQDVAARTDGRAYYVFDGHIADRSFGYRRAEEIHHAAGEFGGRTA
ncbi:MAG: FAD-dependent oxidoreductase, partial [Halobacteriales archaeon]|nr:FAD-dependent oxidoreductase [Halobacteriales archaeon]